MSTFSGAIGLHRGGNLYKATLDGACLSTMDDADHHWEKKTNESEDRDDLRNLIFLINAVPDKEYLNFSHSYLAYDGMVNIIALNMLLSNGSTYYHNYYMFHDIMGHREVVHVSLGHGPDLQPLRLEPAIPSKRPAPAPAPLGQSLPRAGSSGRDDTWRHQESH